MSSIVYKANRNLTPFDKNKKECYKDICQKFVFDNFISLPTTNMPEVKQLLNSWKESYSMLRTKSQIYEARYLLQKESLSSVDLLTISIFKSKLRERKQMPVHLRRKANSFVKLLDTRIKALD